MTAKQRRLELETGLTYAQHLVRKIEVSSEGLPKAPATSLHAAWLKAEGARRLLVEHLNTRWDDA